MPPCMGAYGPRRRDAFASCRSQPIRLPRCPWYQATATWTSPWKKSRSASSAARHASSSSSCAAKNSPRRIRSSPVWKLDANVAALDVDGIGLDPDRVVELVETRADVVLPPVPGAGQDVIRERALAERPVEVQAGALGRVPLAVDVGQRELALAGADAAHRPGGDVLDLRDGEQHS